MRGRKFLLLLLLLIPIKVFSLDYPNLNSKVVEIYDLNDAKVLYEIKANDVNSIASLTKIATAMVAIENIKNLDEKLTITSSMLNLVSREAHVAGLRVGNIVTYRDLLYATLVTSGADAATSLAIASSGSLSNHVNKMNELAKKVGLVHTNFKNVVGLDEDNQYSTADDVLKLLLYALNNHTFKEIYTTKKYTLTNGLVVNTTLKLYDKNGTVDTSFIIGSKTGFTNKAGYCLAYLIDVNGHNMLIITLNANRIGNTYNSLIDANTLVKFLKNNYKEEILVEKGKLIKILPVELSNIDNYEIKATNEVTKYLPSDFDIKDLKIVYEGKEELNFRDDLQDKIGEVSYYYQNKLLLKEDVILNEEISINILKVIKRYYLVLISVFIIIICSVIYYHRKHTYKHKSHKIQNAI